MFPFVFLVVLAVIPPQYHSLGLDFSSLIGSNNSTTGAKGFQELCEHFCDEGDYSDDLFGDLIDEFQPRVLCWICNKKGRTTKNPKSTTTAPTSTTAMTTTSSSTTTTSTGKPTSPITTTTSTGKPTSPITTTTSTTTTTTAKPSSTTSSPETTTT